MKKTVIHLAAPYCPAEIRQFCLADLKAKIAGAKDEIELIVIDQPADAVPSHHQLYSNILAGLGQASGDLVFIAEHDCIYPAGYFDAEPAAALSYSRSVVYLDRDGYFTRPDMPGPLSTLMGPAAEIRECIETLWAYTADGGTVDETEPRTYNGVERTYKIPVVDIRHGANYTGGRPAKYHKKTKAGLPPAADVWAAIDALADRADFNPAPCGYTDAEIMEAYPPVAPGHGGDYVIQTHEMRNAAGDVVAITGTLPATLLDALAAGQIVLKEEPETFRIHPPVCVIVTTRDEPLLAWTVANVRRTAPDAEIIVVPDGVQRILAGLEDWEVFRTPWNTPQGVGPCRDLGTTAARGKIMVFLDAHMDFADGWLEKLIAPVIADGTVVSCARSGVLRPDALDRHQCREIRAGAVIVPNGPRGPLAAHWTNPVPPGSEVQCVLGACYAMTWERYVEIGRPWRNAVGWGHSEPTLCLVNWFAGGRAVVTDAVAYHVYRDNDEIPYDFGAIQKIGRVYNPARLVRLLPMPAFLKARLLAAAYTQRALTPYAAAARDLLDRVDDSDVESRFVRTWADFLDAWPQFAAAGETQPKATPPRRPAPAVVRRSAADPFADDVDALTNSLY